MARGAGAGTCWKTASATACAFTGAATGWINPLPAAAASSACLPPKPSAPPDNPTPKLPDPAWLGGGGGGGSSGAAAAADARAAAVILTCGTVHVRAVTLKARAIEEAPST